MFCSINQADLVLICHGKRHDAYAFILETLMLTYYLSQTENLVYDFSLKQGVQHRMVLAVNFFIFLKLLFFALLLLSAQCEGYT